jgi:hypothetical protein
MKVLPLQAFGLQAFDRHAARQFFKHAHLLRDLSLRDLPILNQDQVPNSR